MLLYYALAVDSTILTTLSSIAAQQSKATETTKQHMSQLLDYCHMHPNAKIRYHAGDMILRLRSNAAFQSKAQAWSQAEGHFFMGNKADNQPDQPNGALLSTSTIMRHVMSLAAKAKCGALFLNKCQAVPLQTTLEEMGHPQPPCQSKSITFGFANRQIKQRCSQSMDMRFYWIQDCVDQNQFHIYWRPRPTNYADYHNKHHLPAHHRQVRHQYVHTINLVHDFCEGVLIPLWDSKIQPSWDSGRYDSEPNAQATDQQQH